MLEYCYGDLLAADAGALVNPVNCVGVMGKGLALQFRTAFPANYAAYRAACARGEVQPGRLLVVVENQRTIINLPTKRHWRARSRLDDVLSGIAALDALLHAQPLPALAVPALGCGYGGLDWSSVEPELLALAARWPQIRWLIYPPGPV